jgi:hypothetical protein
VAWHCALWRAWPAAASDGKFTGTAAAGARYAIIVRAGKKADKGKLTMNEHTRPLTLSERADELEEAMMHQLTERIITKSALFNLADGKVEIENGQAILAANPGKYFLMGADPRLPPMPEKPTLIDFFKARFATTSHLLQSATHALKAGHSEKVVLACPPP